MGKFFGVVVVLGLCSFLFAALAKADMPAERRVAIVLALKNQGIVGENNKGMLEFRGEPKAEEVVTAENRQRQAAYDEIARRQGTTVDTVGAARAAQIAAEAPAGTWLQKPDGSWHQKQ